MRCPEKASLLTGMARLTMIVGRARSRGSSRSMSPSIWQGDTFCRGATLLTIVGFATTASSAQHPSANPPLVFDGVTVVDVAQGKLLPAQRVVITGNRTHSVGSKHAVSLPSEARIINAEGKYLIPGLWDMHVHPEDRATDLFYPLFLVHGITGIRNAKSSVPLDTLIRWRREILAGTRIGPPRQLLSGPGLVEQGGILCPSGRPLSPPDVAPADVCITPANARHVVDSLEAAGADMLKMYGLARETYFTAAAEARRLGVLFGGHLDHTAFDVRASLSGSRGPSAAEASDSGAHIIDHTNAADELAQLCLRYARSSSFGVEECRPLAERLKRNGTWWVPTLAVMLINNGGQGIVPEPRTQSALARHVERARKFWPDSTLRDMPGYQQAFDSSSTNLFRFLTQTVGPSSAPGALSIAQQVGVPILAGTDVASSFLPDMLPGLTLHTELELLVEEGMSPLNALQSATLNPAIMMHATDSLGTIAPGKLADLVLLDANPLADITNTTTIRAVVANGRYYDRVALDRLLADVRAKGR